MTNPDSTRDSAYYNELSVERFDELNNRSKSIYDVRGNLLYSLADWNATDSAYKDSMSYSYETFNRLVESEDPKGFVTKYWYNPLLRVSADSTVDRGKNYYIYDKVGNLRFKKDASGTWVYGKYDALNRLKEQGVLPDSVTPTQQNAYNVNYPNGIGEEWKIKNQYDAYSTGVVADDSANNTNPRGNLTQVQDQSGHTYYFYDRRNRLVQKNVYISGLLAEKKVKYHYNYADQTDTLYYPDGSKVAYLYDEMGRLKGIPGYVSQAEGALEYEPWGAVKRIISDNLVTTTIDYDIRGLTRAIRHSQILNLLWGRSYAHDATGNITQEYSVDLFGDITDTLRTYDYDDLYRLTSAQLEDYNKLVSYAYDQNGNRTMKAVNSDTVSYFYNSNTDRLNHTTGQANNNYLYDSKGSMTQDSSKSMTIYYDYRNMPTSIYRKKTVIGQQVSDILNFYYNAQGQRVMKRFTFRYQCECNPWPPNPDKMEGGKALGPGGRCICATDTYIYYIYSGSQVIAEYTKDDRLVAKYVYGTGQRLAKVDSLGHKFYYHNDYLGSTRVMSDQQGNKVFERDYYPFGEELMVSGYNTNYKYNGKEFDGEAGINLYYYGARYYDPNLGRFISVDPVRDYTNPYSYVRNNPLNAIDPTGKIPLIIPRLTQGGFFGGFASDLIGGREEGFWGPIAAALTAYYRNPNDYFGFTNASGKTDRQEDYEWAQHQRSWAANVAYQLTEQANKTLPSSASDPKLVYNRKYQTIGLFEWYEKGQVWVLIRLMDATDKILNWAGTNTPCGELSELGTFDILPPEYKGELYGGWVLPTTSLGPLRSDGTRYRNLIHGSPNPDVFNDQGGYELEGTCGCIRVSNYDMDWLLDYYYQHSDEDWFIEWRKQ